jgi:hypothetical protein
MRVDPAPGLPADWLNGWLAAVGVAALLHDVRLSWSDDAAPVARFHHCEDTPLARRIAMAMPDEVALRGLVLASLSRKVTLRDFQAAAERSRSLADASLSFSVTDLIADRRIERVDLHGPFDPPAPQGKTLLDRVLDCRRRVEADLDRRIDDTLAGTGIREKANGLGFDIRRIPSGVQPDASVMVDPVVECLCFAALPLFPLRGNGSARLQRGWTGRAGQRGAFRWPVWSEPLNVWAIDALLDRFYAGGDTRLLGVTGAFATVPFQRKGSSDVTRGYASERVGR